VWLSTDPDTARILYRAPDGLPTEEDQTAKSVYDVTRAVANIQMEPHLVVRAIVSPRRAAHLAR